VAPPFGNSYVQWRPGTARWRRQAHPGLVDDGGIRSPRPGLTLSPYSRIGMRISAPPSTSTRARHATAVPMVVPGQTCVGLNLVDYRGDGVTHVPAVCVGPHCQPPPDGAPSHAKCASIPAGTGWDAVVGRAGDEAARPLGRWSRGGARGTSCCGSPRFAAGSNGGTIVAGALLRIHGGVHHLPMSRGEERLIPRPGKV